MFYLLLRKEGNTLNRESLCSFCYINYEAFDNAIVRAESVFPQHSNPGMISVTFRIS